jgi:hypothetical protein
VNFRLKESVGEQPPKYPNRQVGVLSIQPTGDDAAASSKSPNRQVGGFPTPNRVGKETLSGLISDVSSSSALERV